MRALLRLTGLILVAIGIAAGISAAVIAGASKEQVLIVVLPICLGILGLSIRDDHNKWRAMHAPLKPLPILEHVFVTVHPLGLDSKEYQIEVQNCGEFAHFGLDLYFSDLLGPGDFGLDDTHMTERPPPLSPKSIESLPCGACCSYSVVGYGTARHLQNFGHTRLVVQPSTGRTSSISHAQVVSVRYAA